MSGMMRLMPLVLTAAIGAGMGWSCSTGDRHDYVPDASDPERVPTMSTTDVQTFISDSGYTRYQITTPLWQIFDEAEEPFWRFPGGLHLRQFDEHLRPSADIVCDSARYLSRRRIWQLDGHVVLVNTQRDSFLTQQLFWDQNRQKVYSDSFIHIVRQDRIIEGYGFESNQNMTAYSINRPTGIIPVERPAPAAETVQPDSSTESADPRSRRRSAPVRASERARMADGAEAPADAPLLPQKNHR